MEIRNADPRCLQQFSAPYALQCHIALKRVRRAKSVEPPWTQVFDDSAHSSHAQYSVVNKNKQSAILIMDLNNRVTTYIVTDRVLEIGFSGSRTHPKYKFNSSSNLKKAFLPFLPNFWHIWWIFKIKIIKYAKIIAKNEEKSYFSIFEI